MLPHVVLHIGVSLDGRLDWYAGDEGLYYEVAGRWNVDALLSGSNTILTAYAGRQTPEEELAWEPAPSDPADERQWLLVVDSKGQIRNWHVIRTEPYWRDVIVLCSRATPQEYLDYLTSRRIEHIVAGEERVDLRAALEELGAHYGMRRVRVDSGGTLAGVLLREGLVDEVSVLVNPALVGGTSARSMFVAPDLTSPEGVIPLKLLDVEKLCGDVVWLHYQVVSF
jgi:2,5-diamino-6-(ribosylamino)-4(3H)-pyrimidinone 5'-phosphate reductase